MAAPKLRELSDEEVFGTATKPGEMSDEDVFGPAPPKPPAPPERPWFRPATAKPTSDAITSAVGLEGMPQRVASEAISPIAEYIPRQQAAARSGLDMMGAGVENVAAMESPLGVAKGVGQSALGALGYLSSPIQAGFQAISEPATNLVGQPVENLTGGAVPAEVTGNTISALVPGGGITKLPGAGRMTPAQRLAQPPARPSSSAPPKPVQMGTDDLRTMGNAAYKEAEDAGVIFTPGGMGRLYDDVKEMATKAAYDENLHPALRAVISRLDQAKGQATTFEGLDVLHRIAQGVRKMRDNPDQSRIAGMIANRIDDMITSPKAADILVGDAPGAAASIRRGRGAWKQMRKSETIDEALETAAINTEKSGSGGNIDNNTRSAFAAILKDERALAPFSAAERKLMRNVVRGGGPITSRAQGILRLAGKLSPQGNGLMLWGSIAGTALGGPMVAALPIAGFVAKKTADAMTRGNVGKLAREVRKVPQEQFQVPQDFLPPSRPRPPGLPPSGGQVPMSGNLLQAPGGNVIPLRGRTY